MGIFPNSNNTPEHKYSFETKHYKPNEIELLNEKLQKIDKAIKMNLKLDNDNQIDRKIKFDFWSKYGQYIDIKRFAIPIIGAIDSGKSTFLNNFLNLHNILQTGQEVTTRFITIIRHDKNAKIPELYKVEIQKRNNGAYFNFIEKGQNLIKLSENKNISKVIEELNKDIEINNKSNSDKYKYDIDKYFLILKTKIPLFEGEYEEYGNLIDFLDIPGLDEVEASRGSSGDIFKDFIKIIFANIIFPLFIIDLKTIETDNFKIIFKKYLTLEKSRLKRNLNNENKDITYKKGIYLINKIDLSVNQMKKEEYFQNFIKIFTELATKELNINIPFKENENLFGISAKQLTFDNKDSFIKDIIIEAKNSKKNSFKAFIKEYLSRKYGIDLNKAKEEKENYDLKEELELINFNLKNSCKNLMNPKLDLKEYTYISKFNINNEASENIENNKIMFLKVRQKIKDELDNFLKFNLEGLIPKIDINDLEKKIQSKEIIYNSELLGNLINKMGILFPDNVIEKSENIKEIMNSMKNFNSFYINNKIRIIFIGQISSGKTSLLNTIIGNNYNILQTTLSECTKCIYIIKYSKTISFCESELKYNKYGSYFEDKNDTMIYDINEIKNKITKLNEEASFKYYTLYVPIESLESIKFKENIELIDLPGIKKNLLDEMKINDLNRLINMSDGFIFNYNSLNISDENSQLIFNYIISHIKNKFENFEFENCLFNLNYIDDIGENLLNDKINDFKTNIMKIMNCKIFTGDFLEKLLNKDKILTPNDINVSYISNLYYNQYQEFKDRILSLKFITNEKIEDIYNELIENFDEDMIEQLINKSELEKSYRSELQKNVDIINQKTSDKNNKYILKLAKFLIIFDKHNKELVASYKSSKAEIFFQKFINQMNVSKKNNIENLQIKFMSYILELLFQLYYYNELCSNENNLEFYKKRIELKKSTIENEYKNIINTIDKKFSDKKKEIEEFKTQALNELKEEEKKLTEFEITERIKEFGFEEKINKKFDLLYNDLKEIKYDFIYFCIDEISDLLAYESLQEILSTIISSFINKNNKELINMTMISSSIFLISSFGASLATSELGITLGLLGVSYAGIFVLTLVPILLYKYFTNNNAKKIKEYFDRVNSELDKNKNKFKKMIEGKKNEFIMKLEKSDNISKKEINLLKEFNYENNFKNLMKLFKE